MAVQVKDATGATQTIKTIDDVAYGAGAVGTNVQRHTLASDDPAVTALGTIGTSPPTLPGSSTGALGLLRLLSSLLPTSLGGNGGLKIEGVASGTAVPVSAAALPLPTGAATAAKQPALGTAGTPSTDVISIQGVASGTVVPVSAASLPLPTGAATAVKQPAIGTAGTPSTDVISVQGVASGTAMPVSLAGQYVTSVGVFAVASGSFTRPANTTAYVSGQIIANSTTAGSCTAISLTAARANDTSGAVRRVRVRVNDSAWLNATVRVRFFRNSPTFATGDGSAIAANITESESLGYCDVTLDQSFSDYTAGIGAPAIGGEMNFVPTSGAQTIFAVLEARSGVTPAASKVFSVFAEVYQN